MEEKKMKLRARSNDGTTLVLEQLNGEDALTYIAETPGELADLKYFPVGTVADCLFVVDPETKQMSFQMKSPLAPEAL